MSTWYFVSREPQVVVASVGYPERASVGKPADTDVLFTSGVGGQMRRLAARNVHDEKVLIRVVLDPSHQKRPPVRRPASSEIPGWSGNQRPLNTRVEVLNHDVHVAGVARIIRER